ncbi:MAG: hypothetical protein ACI9VR_003821 [Cognaticolwellia sp.]|jgi:hypothetical protein
MKTCPVCGTTYDTRVDFCFRDGEVLVKAPAANRHGADSTANLPEDEFDRPLPDTRLPATGLPDAALPNTGLPNTGLPAAGLPAKPPAALPRQPAPSATDLPQPRYVSSAADLPEPVFLQRETVAETAPFPTTPAPTPRAPIPDDETLPMLLEGGVIPLPISEESIPLHIPGPASKATPEPVFAPLNEPGTSPKRLPLPPLKPAPEPELDAWATPEPPPRMDEKDDGGGPPWAIIALVALLLIGVGSFFAWRTTQTDPGQPVADASPLPEQTAEPTVQAPEPVVAQVAAPKPAAADLEPVKAAPEPGVTPPNGVPKVDPSSNAGRVRDPAVASRQPATTPAQPWDAPEPSDTPQNGTIKIKSVPVGAVLFMDGRRLGTSPQSVDTTQGRHRVRAEADGYKAVEIMVSLNGDLANANLTLQRDIKTQQVMLYGPTGAKSVRVAGQTINALPATITLPVGRHVFTVTQADGSSFQVSQSIAQGAQANVMLLPPE